MKKLSQGAEAIIYLDKHIIKDRIRKKYRLEQIDDKLRRFRTKREAKILTKLEQINFSAPRLINLEHQKIVMSEIKGKLVKDILEKKDYIRLSKEIGKKIAILHDNDIIHGDLTTSNMIFNKEIYLIDFGLSFFSAKIEDKAVDLHLLRQALESKHYKIWEKCFKAALQGYKADKEILKRLEIVEGRGRYKGKALTKS